MEDFFSQSSWLLYPSFCMDSMGAIIHNWELEHQHLRTHRQDARHGLKFLAVLASALSLSHLCHRHSHWPSWCVRADRHLSEAVVRQGSIRRCIRFPADHKLQNTAVSIITDLHRQPVGLDCYRICDDYLGRMFLLKDFGRAPLLQKVLQN